MTAPTNEELARMLVLDAGVLRQQYGDKHNYWQKMLDMADRLISAAARLSESGGPSGMRLVPEEASGMFTPEQEKFLALVMDKTRARGHRLSNVEILRELAAAPEAK